MPIRGLAASRRSPDSPAIPAAGQTSTGYALNAATFRGEYAVGGSLMCRLPGDTPVAVNVGFSYAGKKNNGVRVGAAGEF